MNEKRIQQVLDIEQKAQSAYEDALNEAKQLPIHAEQEAQTIIERAKAEAEEEAHQMVAKAQSEEESKKIMADAQEKIRRSEVLAQSNFNRAVTEVLCRIVGKE